MKELRKVLVTGGTGFLGCRLVERLLFAERVQVRAMAHRPGGTARLARLPVEIAWADITDPGSVRKAIEGCDVVVHCAYGTGGDRKAKHQVTVQGTRLLAEAALACDVRRFVHVSTVAVYSISPPPAVSEVTPVVRSGDPYCEDKIQAEEVIWQFVRQRGLPATVLRMGNMYGPYSMPWTVRPLAHIRDGYVVLVDEGQHASNALFVDNAVEAILLAIREEASVGEAFFVTDDETSWSTWYGCYAGWLGGVPLLSVSSQDLEAMLHPPLGHKLRVVSRDLWYGVALPSIKCVGKQARMTQSLGSAVDALWKRVPQGWREYVGQGGGLKRPRGAGIAGAADQKPRPVPPLDLLQVYRSRTVFSNDKVRHVLGYGPEVSFDQAARITERWARWARLV